MSGLQRRGLVVSNVNGDDEGPVRSVISHLGIPASRALSLCSPENKRTYIEGLAKTKNSALGPLQNSWASFKVVTSSQSPLVPLLPTSQYPPTPNFANPLHRKILGKKSVTRCSSI